MAYPARTPQLPLDLGPLPDPTTQPVQPHLILGGPDNGCWVVTEPGLRDHLFSHQAQAVARYGWLLSFWRAAAHFEEVNGDLYDTRSGKRLRHGYRQLFYHICDGHQLRATLRYVESEGLGKGYTFFTDSGDNLCPACVRYYLRDVTLAVRHYDHELVNWRVVGCEAFPHETTPAVRCDECGADFFDQEA